MNSEVFMLGKARFMRVNRTKAKKAYIDGATVIIAPVKANMNYALCDLYTVFNRIELKASYGYTPHFDTFVNEYCYYNCNFELGNYPKFFISESEV